MKILLTGSNGQVGRDLSKMLPTLGDVTAMDRRQLDLSRPGEIRQAIRNIRPSLIVNAAAYTAVDRAESDEAAAHIVNGEAPGVMAEEAKKVGALLVHYSTDYVFDGTKRTPYLEEDAVHPQNAYGRTKLAGERAIRQVGGPHLIFRTAWVYAPEGKNFLLTILRLATQREELKVVADQIGAPTTSLDIASATTRILARCCNVDRGVAGFSEAIGTYHMTAGGETSWHGFAEAILEEATDRAGNQASAASDHGQDNDWFAAATQRKPLVVRRILGITTPEYPTPAVRPSYSVLSNERLSRVFFIALPHWRTQLHALFSERSPEASVSIPGSALPTR